MKPAHIKCQRLKEVRRIWKRQWEISKELRTLGHRKLEVPIRHGWYKEFVVTKKIGRYKHQNAMLEVIDVLEKYAWGRTKEEAARRWNTRISEHLIVKDIPTLSKRQFNKLSDKAKAICVPFKFYQYKHKTKTRFYVKLPKGTYRIKFTRAYITHRRNIDPLLEQEYSFLSGLLMRNGYYETEQKLYPWNSKWDYPNTRIKKSEVKLGLQRLKKYEIQDIINEELSWEKN
ncbi:hypothetical protein [uncultured Dokdonia sp.]|uniref:hypothetical protein n=1 Tax=uncultured Dokdonia sp. TaxID=575653 RepID=UPI002613952E|nr:hypothetical protein [uncultured Dokdonia sp.]